MNFKASHLSYQQTGYFSKIITDYLNQREFLRFFYTHPVSKEGISAAIQDRERVDTDRKLLVRALEEQYGHIEVLPMVKENLEKLADKNTFTITTAHQPAIFTGSLYFIYKILHVIKIAETLKAADKTRHFVPVFFMGSEDADIDELGHIYLDKEKLTWQANQSGAVGRMKPERLDPIISRIGGEFSNAPHGLELIQLLKTCYLGAENIQQATLKLLNQLFGSYGLIVLIPDNRLLKSVMLDIFRDDLTKHIPYEITKKNIEKLSEQYTVQANPREINLFYLKDNIRERIEKKSDTYRVHQTDIQFTEEELKEEMKTFPERFSPNVILRGLFQEKILPNIAFVGGGGEMAYWLELKPLFAHYGVPYPVLILRNSFLLIKKNLSAKIQRAGLQADMFFKEENRILEEFVRLHSDKQLNLETQQAALKKVYGLVRDISGSVDKTLEPHVEKLSVQALKKLVELEKKIIRAEKKNHDEVRQKIHEIRDALFPLGNLQERIENFIPWYAEYGNSFIKAVLGDSLSLEQNFTILEEA